MLMILSLTRLPVVALRLSQQSNLGEELSESRSKRNIAKSPLNASRKRNCSKGKNAVIYETQEQLDQALALWQDRMGLNDWRIKAKLAPRRDIRNYSEGECTTSPAHRHAYILLCRPKDLNADSFDQQFALVHELVHVWLWSWRTPTELEETVMEQTVNLIARQFMLAWERE
jgi:hypothetical protein